MHICSELVESIHLNMLGSVDISCLRIKISQKCQIFTARSEDLRRAGARRGFLNEEA